VCYKHSAANGAETTLIPWLGKSSDPNSPAALTSKLGFNLFTTKGLEPGFWESISKAFQGEGVNELIKMLGAILLTILLIMLGLKAGKP
jgi:hypothetical protein